jgi:hypothetical protein
MNWDQTMTSTVQELAGINRALDHLELRVKEYRKLLCAMDAGERVEGEIDRTAVTEGELESIESMVRRVARRITGELPVASEWESMRLYCNRNEEKKSGWAAQNLEYFRWSLFWIDKTRTYLEYLAGMQLAAGEPPKDSKSQSLPESDGDRSTPRYDVALSFAGEDRMRVRRIAHLLISAELSIFYDEYEQASLWGRNLYTHLSDVYQNKARYCLMFISANYAEKLWTKREREAAQSRAFRESVEYILPLRLDDTVLPGIDPTVAYVDLRQTSDEEVVRLVLRKLGRGG